MSSEKEEENHPWGFWSLNEEKILNFCGFKRTEIEEIADKVNYKSDRIFEFLTYCRHGLSQIFMATLTEKDNSTVSRNFNQVIDKLSESFVPKYLG